MPLQCGMIVACFLQKYKDEIPQIGKVIDITTIQLYQNVLRLNGRRDRFPAHGRYANCGRVGGVFPGQSIQQKDTFSNQLN